MDGSATELGTREDWEASLAEEDDLSDLTTADDVTDEAVEAEVEEAETAEPEAPEPEPAPEQEADAEAQPEVEVEAEADADAEPEQPEAAEPGEAPTEPDAPTAGDLPAPEQTEYTPFVAKADGIEIPLDGAVLAEGEVRIPLDTFRRQLQPFLADRGSLSSKYDRMVAAYEAKLGARSEAEAKAEKAFDNLGALLDRGPDAVWQWLQDFEPNKASLIAEAEKAGLQAKIDTYAAADSQRSAEDANARRTRAKLQPVLLP